MVAGLPNVKGRTNCIQHIFRKNTGLFSKNHLYFSYAVFGGGMWLPFTEGRGDARRSGYKERRL